MKKLDVINNMLATLGETPVTQVDYENDYQAAGLRILSQKNELIQASGYWFNREAITLLPDANFPGLDGKYLIKVPFDTIRCDPRGRHRYVVTQRGDVLYDTDKNTKYFDPKCKVECELTRLIPFEDLPSTAAYAVNAAAVMSFQVLFDADRAKLQILAQEMNNCLAQLNAENVRNMKSNLLYTNSTLRRMRGVGDNYF